MHTEEPLVAITYPHGEIPDRATFTRHFEALCEDGEYHLKHPGAGGYYTESHLYELLLQLTSVLRIGHRDFELAESILYDLAFEWA